MRLLETAPAAVPKLHEFIGSHTPAYAILSHTWDADEVTLQQLAAADLFALRGSARFDKIQGACALARTRDALDYVWVDTCCIDKTSSAELSEAINSMFAWYRDAAVCYVYLSDLKPGEFRDLFRDLPACRWFTRGWTLQELVAPRKVLFFDREWNYRGSKKELAQLLETITNIPMAVLRHEAELNHFAVARRMSWAANRETTRVEDVAYCLLGIFDVNLSLIYGEGIKAFARLQAAILQSTPDLSIFAWVDYSITRREYAGILANGPAQFAHCKEMGAAVGDLAHANFTMTTRGIQTDASLISARSHETMRSAVVLDTRCLMGGIFIGVHIRKIGGSLYARFKPYTLFRADEASSSWEWTSVETLTLATNLPTRFPFHTGIDPVVGNRCSTLRVIFRPFNERNAQQMPRSHFDTEQGAFFSCDPDTKGWCACVKEGSLTGGSVHNINSNVDLTLFFACFGWDTETPVVVLASLNGMNPATGMLLKSLLTFQLGQVKFESWRQAQDLVLGAFGDNLVYRGPVLTNSRTIYLYEGSSPWTQLHSFFRVQLKMWKEIHRDVSFYPTTMFEIFFSLDVTSLQPLRLMLEP
ncbi:hypothetical protein CHGG_02256 [Chaetomium globosum CBS 148.51]|uniref:Uncharacterized protein n=1 Tax=Chaetomium globosum (strain ATCC 6205 / CBS 148.51 / DSM 1962 / NBRC 6347 / NRRL 1970) TaxID=306901 RepID=Q2HBZ8_CHAGB|nr:uncharacterized protein CHGG_02256 [Chaetomium globosum CBS 148.51]EAQ90321.1 hypothetical protein CHGG_02256 [Chaetomium globosum CBS 148.51]